MSDSPAPVLAPQPPLVLVVGSLHYDIIVDAPDRPRRGETVTGRGWAPKFGGKGGNQAAAARAQGVATAMVGAVGADGFGAALLTGLDRAGVDRSAVRVCEREASGMSVAIFDDGGDYGAVIVSGANLTIAPEQATDDLLRRAKILVLQNEIPEAVNEAVARRARSHGVTTILNAAPARAMETSLPDLVDLLIVNAVESEMMGSGPVKDLGGAVKAAETLSQRFGAVVVTAGGHGVAYRDRAGRSSQLSALPVTVCSTHGAGDAFVGTLAARIALGETALDALGAANQTAAQLVSTPERLRGALLG